MIILYLRLYTKTVRTHWVLREDFLIIDIFKSKEDEKRTTVDLLNKLEKEIDREKAPERRVNKFRALIGGPKPRELYRLCEIDPNRLELNPEFVRALRANEGYKGWTEDKPLPDFSKAFPNVTDISNLFRGVRVKKLDLCEFDTGNIKHMNYTFSGCELLKELCIDTWNCSNVETSLGMFEKCMSLKEINAPYMPKAYDLSFMFKDCENLLRTNLENLVASSVRSVVGMFQNCGMLQFVKIPVGITSDVEDMSYMFSGCSLLKEIDFVGGNMPCLSFANHTFKNCFSLRNSPLQGEMSLLESMVGAYVGCKSISSVELPRVHMLKNTDNIM